ncbi:hypothetical protein HYY69_06215 [Candidatus Woesearchaeota archaeon]|nr:hypothetical protein [Candidatus Woesearchaeota archaeon]
MDKEEHKRVEHALPENSQEQKPTEHDIKKYTRNFLIVAGVIIILFGVILAFVKFYKPQDTTLPNLHKENLKGKTLATGEKGYVYNGFSFVHHKGSWYTQIFSPSKKTKYDIPLHYGPTDLENVSIDGNFKAFFDAIMDNNISKYQNQAYLTFNPNEENLTYVNLAIGELNINFRKVLNTHLEFACTEEAPACDLYNATIVTCSNASQQTPVFYFKSDPETKVLENNYCVTIQGTNEELLRSVDRLLYKMYLVMD